MKQIKYAELMIVPVLIGGAELIKSMLLPN